MAGIVETLAGVVGIAAGVVVIVEYRRRAKKARHFGQIVHPPVDSKCGGRHVTITGIVPTRNRESAYWVAIQPSDCRGAGHWWPQKHTLDFDQNGHWELRKATLGRDGEVGKQDIGKTYTLALVEVPEAKRELFQDAARRDERLVMPVECHILHSIEVERVSW
jgi:hypothetical protein